MATKTRGSFGETEQAIRNGSEAVDGAVRGAGPWLVFDFATARTIWKRGGATNIPWGRGPGRRALGGRWLGPKGRRRKRGEGVTLRHLRFTRTKAGRNVFRGRPCPSVESCRGPQKTCGSKLTANACFLGFRGAGAADPAPTEERRGRGWAFFTGPAGRGGPPRQLGPGNLLPGARDRGREWAAGKPWKVKFRFLLPARKKKENQKARLQLATRQVTGRGRRLDPGVSVWPSGPGPFSRGSCKFRGPGT